MSGPAGRQPTTRQHLQDVQSRAYREAVEVVEAKLGAALPRFRGVEFCIVDYQKPADLGQAPFYRRFPGLTAKPWWDRSAWPSDVRAVLARFETEFPALREEFEAGIPSAREAFSSQTTGYFGFVDQWLSYPLVTESCEPVPEAFAAFPKLSRLLAELIELRAPCKTYFALMRSGVHLEEHCGGQNISLRMHVGLRIPPGDAALRVGGVQHGWEDGKQLFFDDTFVHEAWNRTGRDRYILLMRLMHPELSPIERAAHFLIEREFRSSAAFLSLSAEIQADAARAKEANRNRASAPRRGAPKPPPGVVLPTVGQSPSSPWAALRPSTTRVDGAFLVPASAATGADRQRPAPPPESALYAWPPPRWVTVSTSFAGRHAGDLGRA